MRTLILIFCSICIVHTSAQDIIITISGYQIETPLELDSIRIENLNNGTNLSLANFPSGVFDYKINLTQGTYNSVPASLIQQESIELLNNRLGVTQLLIKVPERQEIGIGLFDINGRTLLKSNLICESGDNIIEITTDCICLIQVNTKKQSQNFKSVGVSSNLSCSVTRLEGLMEKSWSSEKDEINFTSFIFTPGDSLKIIGSKINYHSGFVVKTPLHLDHYTIYLCKPCEGAETVTDYDGNIYNTVQIDNQCWMKENLNTTHYADGTPLVDGTGIPTIDITTKYWFNYDDNPSNAEVYGKLYSWAAVMNGEPGSNSVPSGVQGVCPDGWHVPGKAEWEILVEKFGGDEISGGKLKETGYEHWNYPNTGANNQSGLTVLGNGRQYLGTYGGLKIISSFWTASWYLGFDSYGVFQYHNQEWTGFSGYQNVQQGGSAIRCIKD
jgi:uncharacterized protein (TIGR02145 family)